MSEVTCTPATGELVALAVAVRPDWDETQVRAALVSAAQAGLSWPAALRKLTRLMTEPGGRPRELIPADPRKRAGGLTRDRNHANAQKARDLLAAAIHDKDQDS